MTEPGPFAWTTDDGTDSAQQPSNRCERSRDNKGADDTHGRRRQPRHGTVSDLPRVQGRDPPPGPPVPHPRSHTRSLSDGPPPHLPGAVVGNARAARAAGTHLHERHRHTQERCHGEEQRMPCKEDACARASRRSGASAWTEQKGRPRRPAPQPPRASHGALERRERHSGARGRPKHIHHTRSHAEVLPRAGRGCGRAARARQTWAHAAPSLSYLVAKLTCQVVNEQREWAPTPQGSPVHSMHTPVLYSCTVEALHASREEDYVSMYDGQ